MRKLLSFFLVFLLIVPPAFAEFGSVHFGEGRFGVGTFGDGKFGEGSGDNVSFNVATIGTQITTVGQYTNIHMIGDSITNPNNGGAQGTLLVAMMKGWRTTDPCGLTLWQGSNNNGVQSILTGTNFDHGNVRRASGVHSGDPWDNPGGNVPSDPGIFVGANKQFGTETMRDRSTTGTVSAGGQFGGLALVDIVTNDYPADNSWFNNVEVNCKVAAFVEATGMQTFELRGRRRNDGGTVSGSPTPLQTLNLRTTLGSEEVAVSSELTIPTATGAWPYLNFGTTDATGTGETAAILAVRFYKTGTLTGFEVSSSHGGGYETQSFLHPTDSDVDSGNEDYVNNSDVYLTANLEVRGWPNVIWIALGANDGNKPINESALIRRRVEKIILRYAAAYDLAAQTRPQFVLQSPYACTNVSTAAADAMAAIMLSIAQNGVSSYATPSGSPLNYDTTVQGGVGGKISFINTRLAMKAHGAIANGWDSEGVMVDDNSGGTFMVDNIHPTQDGADAVMNTVIYNEVLQ